jgi:hypothetical protein
MPSVSNPFHINVRAIYDLRLTVKSFALNSRITVGVNSASRFSYAALASAKTRSNKNSESNPLIPPTSAANSSAVNEIG